MIRHDLHDILYPAIQRRTNLHEYLRGNMSVPSHFDDGCWADTSSLAQVFFLHVLIDEQLPEFFIIHRHKISPPYRYTKKCSAAWQSIRPIVAILPEPIPTLASVVYYDSIFRRKKQENGGISRFLQKIKTIRIALKFPRDAELAS